MKKKLYIFSLVAIAIWGVGCKKYLDPKIDDKLSNEQVWKDPDYSMGVLLASYNKLPGFYDSFGSNFLDCATDDASSNDQGALVKIMATGGWSPGYNPLDWWGTCYEQIRNINLFMINGLSTKYSFDPVKNNKILIRARGEAYFMRAWYEWELLQRFGGKATNGQILGFPIVTKVLSTANAEEIDVPRATYAQCVEQITSDLDSAIKYLPNEYTGSDDQLGSVQVGRASGMAAKALKSRMLLYAASPAFSASLTGSSNEELWANAAKAARVVMVNSGNLPAIDFNTPQNFFNNPNHAEFIWRKYAGDSNGAERNNFLPSLWGNGMTNPSQQLVDAFPSSNGYPISDPLSGYNKDAPYSGRDKRLGWSILVNAATFKGVTVETSIGGKDTEAGRFRATTTGYYLRKWMHEGVNLQPGGGGSAKHFYGFLRKTEIWLNYAEAANEAWGPNADPLGLGITAAQALRAIRTRAGFTTDNYLTAVSNQGKDQFRKLVRNERRIELCFENQRFFDLRRWLTPLTELNEPVKGVIITKNSDGSLSYDYSKISEKRSYLNYMYYGPIPETDVLRSNSKLLQNEGW